MVTFCSWTIIGKSLLLVSCNYAITMFSLTKAEVRISTILIQYFDRFFIRLMGRYLLTRPVKAHIKQRSTLLTVTHRTRSDKPNKPSVFATKRDLKIKIKNSDFS